MNDRRWLNRALSSMHNGQWFGFSSKDQSYTTLIVHDSSITKPTEAEINAKIQELKDVKQSNYAEQRRNAYPKIGDQLDMLWHSIDQDPQLKSKYFDFYEAIKAVKVKYPKNG
jgi:hypothetical protein